MFKSSMAKVELISEWFIRPKCEVEQSKNQHHPNYHHLSPPDIFRLSVDYAHHGLLFTKPHSSSSSTSSAIDSGYFEKLRVTLAIALDYFYPLSGRLVTERYEDEHSCCIFVDCNKGPGARLIHAAALNITVMDVFAPNEDVPLFVQSFFDLGERAINYDGHTRPLLIVQVTELLDGVFMGFTMNHCIVDGTSFFYFLHKWSEIFTRYQSSNGGVVVPLSPLPNYKRPPIPDGYGSTMKLPYLDSHEFITRTNGEKYPIRQRIFRFSAAALAMLKAKAKAESIDNTTMSSYQALCALVWRSITRARNLPREEETTCVFRVNIRPRFNPPLSEKHFGNYIAVPKVTTKVGQLLDHSLGWAAILLHRSITAVDHKAARDVFVQPFLEGRPTLQPLTSEGPNPVLVSGSAKFDPYGIEFGLGRAVALRIGTVNIAEGMVITYPVPEGGGSVELTIWLAPHTMAALLSDEEFSSFVTLSPKL